MGGREKLFFTRKKVFPFLQQSTLFNQRVDSFCCAEAAEDGGDEADGTDFAVGKTLERRFGGIDGFYAFFDMEFPEFFADDPGEGAAVGFGNIGNFYLSGIEFAAGAHGADEGDFFPFECTDKGDFGFEFIDSVDGEVESGNEDIFNIFRGA